MLRSSMNSDASNSTTSTSTGETKAKNGKRPLVIPDYITVIPGDPVMYKCKLCCAKEFKTKAYIKYHEFCQKIEKPFTCPECGAGIKTKKNYNYHLKTHTGERPFECPQCGKGFLQRSVLARHIRVHTGEKPFICDTCNKGFAEAATLRIHKLTHNTEERPFTCNVDGCNEKFSSRFYLKKHMKSRTHGGPGSGPIPFKCNVCKMGFRLQSSFDQHVEARSCKSPYVCPQLDCGRPFTNGRDLRRHYIIHSGQKPLSCWICGGVFRRKDNLDKHIQTAHNQPKETAKLLSDEAALNYLGNYIEQPSREGLQSAVTYTIIQNHIVAQSVVTPSSTEASSTIYILTPF